MNDVKVTQEELDYINKVRLSLLDRVYSKLTFDSLDANTNLAIVEIRKIKKELIEDKLYNEEGVNTLLQFVIKHIHKGLDTPSQEIMYSFNLERLISKLESKLKYVIGELK